MPAPRASPDNVRDWIPAFAGMTGGNDCPDSLPDNRPLTASHDSRPLTAGARQ